MKVEMEVVRHSFNVAYYIFCLFINDVVCVCRLTELSFEKNDKKFNYRSFINN